MVCRTKEKTLWMSSCNTCYMHTSEYGSPVPTSPLFRRDTPVSSSIQPSPRCNRESVVSLLGKKLETQDLPGYRLPDRRSTPYAEPTTPLKRSNRSYNTTLRMTSSTLHLHAPCKHLGAVGANRQEADHVVCPPALPHAPFHRPPIPVVAPCR